MSPTEPTATGPTDVFTILLHAVDTLDWSTVRNCFAPEVATDYTSLWGGEPASSTVDELVAWWQPFATGFDATQHLTGPIAITHAEDHGAVAVTTVRAYHHIAGEDGDSGEDGPAGTWIVAGHYRIGLDRSPDGWRISAITLSVAYEQGDRALVDVARQRGETSTGGRFPT